MKGSCSVSVFEMMVHCCRFPAYCISVGLFVEKDPVLGIVYDIPNDKIYSAIKGEGAFCNGRVIKCSSTTGTCSRKY